MTRPGPHAREKSLPLVLVLREVLGYAKTSSEAKKIIKSDKVRVDGIIRRDHRFPVGLMDVVQIEGADQTFRVLPKRGGGFVLSPISKEEANFKLCKVTGRSTVKKGNEQISLHDGRTILYGGKGQQRAKPDEQLTVGSTLQLSIPNQDIIRVIPFQPGTLALVTDGRNQGAYGKLAQVAPGTFARRKMVRLEAESETFETPADYVMPIGTETPLVNLK